MEKFPVNLKAAICELARSGFELLVGVLMEGGGVLPAFTILIFSDKLHVLKIQTIFPSTRLPNWKKKI